jgi:hypothetical protein
MGTTQQVSYFYFLFTETNKASSQNVVFPKNEKTESPIYVSLIKQCGLHAQMTNAA